MKKTFFPLLTLIALLCQLTAFAQQTGPQTPAQITEMLPGTWEWTESRFASRGVKPTLKTPETEQKVISITFRPDNLASLYVNKKFSGMYQYTVTKTTDYAMIRFKSNEGQPLPEFLAEGPVSISDNELYIAGGYNDAGLNVNFRKAGTKPTPAPQAAEPAKPATPAVPAKKVETTTKTMPAKKPATTTKTKTKVKTETPKTK